VIDAWRNLAATGIAAGLLALVLACSGRQSDWETARKADTAEAYAAFLKHYPQGDFTSQAYARLADLKEEADWQTALAADSAQAYQQFIARHPDGARADEARIRIENLNLAQVPVDAPPAAGGPQALVPGNPSPPKPPAPEPAARYRVQLGAFSSATRARSEWREAVKSYPKQLAGLSYTLDKTGEGGSTLFRLQTSVMSESKARAICDALKAARQACVVVVP
jgi:cell division protein FtsN